MNEPPSRTAGFCFRALATDGNARTGVLQTAHGPLETPAFMAVGTAGTVKAMTADAVRMTGCQCVLGNTYHLMLRPGADRIVRLGGLHRFMDWPGPLLTDSGGFQVMSLSALRKIDRDGITFRSHIDGSRHRLTPAICMDLQDRFDSTIAMVLDECTSFPATHEAAEASMDLSMRWAELSKRAYRPRPGYGLFGIVQGSTHADLRLRSASALEGPSVRWLRRWRPCRRRRTARDAGDTGDHRAASAPRSAAIFDGCGDARRYPQRGGARN